MSKPVTKEPVYKKNSDIVSRVILDETILVPISGKLADMQKIFSLDSVSAFIWNQIDGMTDLKTIHQRLLGEFNVDPGQARLDLYDFTAELLTADLIVEIES